MKLLDIETTNVRGLRDGAYRIYPDAPAQGGFTVVTGPRSAGLTTLLDAIAFSAARLRTGGIMPDAADVLRAGSATARVRSRWWLDPDERAYGGVIEEVLEAEVNFRRGSLGAVTADPALLGLMSRYDHSPATWKVALIPARRVTDSAIPPFSNFEVDQRNQHLSSAPDKFAGLPQALVKYGSGHAEKARFDDARRLFDEMAGGTRLLSVSAAGSLQFGVRTGGRLSLAQLSFGERNLFVLASFLPMMGLHRSLILLDTPELGLAPGVASRCVSVLREYAPEAQWIVASRDPAVLEGNNVVELVRGSL